MVPKVSDYIGKAAGGDIGNQLLSVLK